MEEKKSEEAEASKQDVDLLLELAKLEGEISKLKEEEVRQNKKKKLFQSLLTVQFISTRHVF